MLYGEGYFDVTKDPDRKFVVEAQSTEIEVYGTEFNVEAYDDEYICATLVSGRIVSAREGTGTVSPGAGLRVVRGAPPPSTIWANSRITVADKRYFTLILSKIPKNFRTFADKSAKTPGSRLCALPAAFSARQR